MLRTTFVLLLAALALASGSALAEPAPSPEDPSTAPPQQPFTSDEEETLALDRSQRRLTLAVGIGEHGPFDFLVDTGSEATIVSSEVADQLGLPREEERRIVGVGGETMAASVTLDELVVGSRRMRDLPAAVVDGAGIGAEGIIGIESLRDQRVVLDFENSEITVGPSDAQVTARPGEIVVRARARENRLIVHRARLAGLLVDVVIDTGSDFTIGNTALGAKLGRKAEHIATSEMLDALGNRDTVEILLAGKLELGPLSFPRTLIAIADTNVFEELGLTERPAILLGMNHLRLFRRVAVDFHKRRIAFELPDERG